MPNLARFRESYPRLAVDLRESDGFADLIQEGINVAIRVTGTEDSRLIARKLAPGGRLCFARLFGKTGAARTDRRHRGARMRQCPSAEQRAAHKVAFSGR
nr:LysR substrate-binding domain-containing protein [Rhizobium leguminosarum]